MTTDLLLLNTTVVVGMMLLVWLISLPIRNVGIVDIAWGFGFVLIAVATFVTSCPDGTPASAPAKFLTALVAVWGLRLAVHLARRNLGEKEDRRYAAMRESWPLFPLTSLGIVFLLQAAIMLVVALPVMSGVYTAIVEPGGFGVLHVVGTAVWAVGLFFEAVGDWQLADFKSRPENEGRVLDTGLWRYTRHPNYFGDFLVWWGFYLVALGSGAAWWTIVGPIVMSTFLMRVSGVTLLERSLKERKPEYREYVRRTSTFFPRPPREPDSPSSR